MSVKSVDIVGAGIIGLSTAWQLIRRGVRVRIFEAEKVGSGASSRAAGMLSAVAEMGFEELDTYRASCESLRRWPDFARLLEEESGLSVGFGSLGSILVADDRDHAEALRRIFDFQVEQGADVRWLPPEEAQEIEPFLAPGLVASVLISGDLRVDNRKVLHALSAVIQKAGGEIFEHHAVDELVSENGKTSIICRGVRFEADAVLIAAGSWSKQIKGLPDAARPPVRPVKGQIIELTAERPFDLQFVIRGPNAYLVPHSDGRIMVGATSEEVGFDTRVTAGGMYKILKGAWEIVPGIYDLPVEEIRSGLRPATTDNKPIIGTSDVPGVYFATGHFRNGILLSVLTADELSREICEDYLSPWMTTFRPQRFYGN